MKPTYFDLTVRDLDRARVFFEQVLDWRFERFEMPYEYYRIKAGPVGEAGIDGGIGSVKDAPVCEGRPMTQVTIAVAQLDDVLSRVQACGGRIVEPKMPIPGIGWYATCTEPGGLLFGVIQLACHEACNGDISIGERRALGGSRRAGEGCHCEHASGTGQDGLD